MSSECRDCAAGFEHCHGALIHHTVGRDECTEADCERAEVEHAYVVDCETIGCACGVEVSAHRVG